MRRKVNNRNIVAPDFIYNSQKLEKFINYIMWSGKKETARKVMYAAFDIVKEKTGNPNPLEIFDLALQKCRSDDRSSFQRESEVRTIKYQ